MKEKQNFKSFLVKFQQAYNNTFEINFIIIMGFKFNFNSYKVNR